MAYRDGSVAFQEQEGQRLTHHCRAAYNHSAAPGHRDAVVPKDLDDGPGRGGREGGLPHGKAAQAKRVRTVDVLFRRYQAHQGIGADAGRKRCLQDDAMH